MNLFSLSSVFILNSLFYSILYAPQLWATANCEQLSKTFYSKYNELGQVQVFQQKTLQDLWVEYDRLKAYDLAVKGIEKLNSHYAAIDENVFRLQSLAERRDIIAANLKAKKKIMGLRMAIKNLKDFDKIAVDPSTDPGGYVQEVAKLLVQQCNSKDDAPNICKYFSAKNNVTSLLSDPTFVVVKDYILLNNIGSFTEIEREEHLQQLLKFDEDTLPLKVKGKQALQAAFSAEKKLLQLYNVFNPACHHPPRYSEPTCIEMRRELKRQEKLVLAENKVHDLEIFKLLEDGAREILHHATDIQSGHKHLVKLTNAKINSADAQVKLVDNLQYDLLDKYCVHDTIQYNPPGCGSWIATATDLVAGQKILEKTSLGKAYLDKYAGAAGAPSKYALHVQDYFRYLNEEHRAVYSTEKEEAAAAFHGSDVPTTTALKQLYSDTISTRWPSLACDIDTKACIDQLKEHAQKEGPQRNRLKEKIQEGLKNKRAQQLLAGLQEVKNLLTYYQCPGNFVFADDTMKMYDMVKCHFVHPGPVAKLKKSVANFMAPVARIFSGGSAASGAAGGASSTSTDPSAAAQTPPTQNLKSMCANAGNAMSDSPACEEFTRQKETEKEFANLRKNDTPALGGSAFMGAAMGFSFGIGPLMQTWQTFPLYSQMAFMNAQNNIWASHFARMGGGGFIY